MGGTSFSADASPIMARGIPAPYTMSNVCGRTRVVLSLTLMLCILLWGSYLYRVDISQTRPTFLLHGTRRYRPLFKKNDQIRRRYQYRPLGHTSGTESDRSGDLSHIQFGAGRHAHSEKRQAGQLPKWLQKSRIWPPHQVPNKRIMVAAGESDDNFGEDEESAIKVEEYDHEGKVEDFGIELNTDESEQVDRDLKKETVLYSQKKKLEQRADLQEHEPKNKPKTLQYKKILDNRDEKSAKHESYKTDSRHAKALPSFDREKVQSYYRQTTPVKINEALYYDKWIVVTSILQPTPDVMFLSKIPGWKVLVIGDTKTPSNWSLPNCVFLNVADQESLGLSLAERTPYRSYARKNLGYLFAVAHGAKIIYETDDDNRPLDMLKSFQLEPTMSGLMFAGEELFNPYHHFGQSTLWPRGYPLGAVGSAQTQLYKLTSKWKTPAIQQGVVNGDPDMDAIFRLTRKRTFSRLQVNFDPAAPPVILPEGVYSPFNSQNTLFRYESLWAMLLPTTTTFRMCDIWRGYWAQRLLWEISARLAFFPPNAYQQRNAHSYMDDAVDERDMYFQTDRLLEFLSNWSCPRELSFFQCVYLLSEDMAHQKFWEAEDIDVARLWLQDLVRVGYHEPKRVHISDKNNFVISNRERNASLAAYNSKKYQKTNKAQSSGKRELAARRLKTVKNGTAVYFAASQQNPPSVYPKTLQTLSQASHQVSAIASLCPEIMNISVKTDAIKHKQKTYFDDILLVVVFNWPHYANVQYLETIYRNIFPNIAYCGGNLDIFLAETKHLDTELTFINAPVFIGVYGYTCFIAAAQMGYNVTGYMVVGDDVLVNMWNLHGFDKERIWSNFAVHIFNVDNGTNWSWWGYQMGEQAYKKSMAVIKRQQHLQNLNQENVLDDRQFEQTAHFSVSGKVKTASAFLSTLHRNTGGATNCPHAVSDLYYIPARLAPSAVHYMSLFARQGLMVELAISMTIYGLNLREDIQFFSGENLWLTERLDPWRKFNPHSFFLHPVKFSNTSNLQPFCSKYLTALLHNVYQLNSDSNESTDASLAARKVYIEKLQKVYRYRQNLQKTWLQQELLAMKKNKEQRKERAQPQEEERGEQALPNQQNHNRQVISRIVENKAVKLNERDSSSLEEGESERDQIESNKLPLNKRRKPPNKYKEQAMETPTNVEETEVQTEQGKVETKDRQYNPKQLQNVPRKTGSNTFELVDRKSEKQQDKTRNSQGQRRPNRHREINKAAGNLPQGSATNLDRSPHEDVSEDGDEEDHQSQDQPPFVRENERRSVKRQFESVKSKNTLHQTIKDEY